MKRSICDLNNCQDMVLLVRKHRGKTCLKHYRFREMRYAAKSHKKTVPTMEQLGDLLPNDMSCPLCKRTMNWLAKDGTDSVISLQHYRDGSFGLICMSCNARHVRFPGDSFKNAETGQRFCSKCSLVLPLSAFCKDKSRKCNSKFQVASYCRKCKTKIANEWRRKNRKKYNNYLIEYRAKRKAAGRPVPHS